MSKKKLQRMIEYPTVRAIVHAQRAERAEVLAMVLYIDLTMVVGLNRLYKTAGAKSQKLLTAEEEL